MGKSTGANATNEKTNRSRKTAPGTGFGEIQQQKKALVLGKQINAYKKTKEAVKTRLAQSKDACVKLRNKVFSNKNITRWPIY